MRGTGELASDWQDIFVESLMASTAPGAGVVGSTTVALGAVVAVTALPSSVAPVVVPTLVTIATSTVVRGLIGGLAGSDVPADPLLSWRPLDGVVARDEGRCCCHGCRGWSCRA